MKSWTLLVLAALAAGCAAQAGQSTEDPGSTPEQLSAPATPAGTSTIDKTHLRIFRASDGTLYFGAPPQGGAEELRLNVNPGDPAADDGDGREPQPQPWHRTIAPVNH